MAAAAQAGVSVPVFQPDEIRHRRDIAQWAQWANQGHLANVGEVTLISGTASTVVSDKRVSQNSFIGFMPETAKALSAMPTVYVPTIDAAAGTFTIAHSSTASGNRTFRYCLLG